MNELLKIETKENKETVNARDLHTFLESKRNFNDWIKERISSHEFIQEVDFTKHKFVFRKSTCIDYYISISMAKELCMLENNSKGKEARRYFIECENKLKEQIPQTKLEWMKMAVEIEEKNELLQIENKKQDFKIKKIEPKAEMYNRTMDSTTTFSAKEVAKNLNLKKGANTLFKELRKLKILMDRKTDKSHNTPYQRYKNRDYFKVIKVSKGNTGIIYLQTRFYQKGIDFIANKLPKNMFKNEMIQEHEVRYENFNF